MGTGQSRPRKKNGVAFSLEHDLSCVPSKTLLVFHARHSLCSKHDIPCVPNKTFPMFRAKHSVRSNQNFPCVPNKTFTVFRAKHSPCSKQDIPCRKGPRNCEDGCNFGDLRTKSIATTRCPFFIQQFHAVEKDFASVKIVCCVVVVCWLRCCRVLAAFPVCAGCLYAYVRIYIRV